MTKPRGNGIVCPACGGETEVMETRRNSGSLRRRRHCTDGACAGRVTTVEFPVTTVRGRAKDTTAYTLVPLSTVGALIEAVKVLSESGEDV